MIEILSVEDRPEDRAFIEDVLREIAPEAQLTFKIDASAAIESLKTGFYDLLILDLRIPFSDKTPLETDPDHGVSVLGEARKTAPGLPVIIFTGSEYESLVRTFLKAGDKQDIWGCGTKKQTVDLVRKDDKAEFASVLKELVSDLQALGDCDHRNRAAVNLPIDADRLIRIAVRRLNGASYEVRVLGGGKSSSDVYSVRVKDAAGHHLFNLVLKIDAHRNTDKEHECYRLHAQRLQSGHTPRLIERLEYGGYGRAAIVYDLVADVVGDLFTLAEDDERSINALNALANILVPWHKKDGEAPQKIREIRQNNLSDERAAKIANEHSLNWISQLEDRSAQVKVATTHGDLHGGNVLIDEHDRPALIDFNDIGPKPAVFDWITLELSLLFNIDGPARETEWPSIKQCSNWVDLDSYLQDCPFNGFVKTCREKALGVSTGERELLAATYVYLLRQFHYSDTNKDRLLAMIEGVWQRMQYL